MSPFDFFSLEKHYPSIHKGDYALKNYLRLHSLPFTVLAIILRWKTKRVEGRIRKRSEFFIFYLLFIFLRFSITFTQRVRIDREPASIYP